MKWRIDYSRDAEKFIEKQNIRDEVREGLKKFLISNEKSSLSPFCPRRWKIEPSPFPLFSILHAKRGKEGTKKVCVDHKHSTDRSQEERKEGGSEMSMMSSEF